MRASVLLIAILLYACGNQNTHIYDGVDKVESLYINEYLSLSPFLENSTSLHNSFYEERVFKEKGLVDSLISQFSDLKESIPHALSLDTIMTIKFYKTNTLVDSIYLSDNYILKRGKYFEITPEMSVYLNILKGQATKKIESVTIKAVEHSILTFIRIDCESFENAFAGNIREVTTAEPDYLSKLYKLLISCRKINSPAAFSVDTRAKIYFNFADGSHQIVCLDRFYLELNGRLYQVSEGLIELVYSKTEI